MPFYGFRNYSNVRWETRLHCINFYINSLYGILVEVPEVLTQFQIPFEIQQKELELAGSIKHHQNSKFSLAESSSCLALDKGQKSIGDSMSDPENHIWLASNSQIKLDFLLGGKIISNLQAS